MEEDEEVTKEQFKDLYFKYATPYSGWTEDYWNHFFERETGKRYYFRKPEMPEATRMFVSSDKDKHRIFFLTEEAEESFFDFPGKE